MDNYPKWKLKSLTIGPKVHETNTEFLVEAFKNLPPLAHVDNVAIVYHYPKSNAFNTDCWEYFDRVLSRRDLFPALKSVHLHVSCGLYQLNDNHRKWWSIHSALLEIRRRGILLIRTLPAFGWDQSTNSSRNEGRH